MGDLESLRHGATELRVGDFFRVDRTGRTICYVGSANVEGKHLPAFVEVDQSRGFLLVHDDIIVTDYKHITPIPRDDGERSVDHMRPLLKSLNQAEKLQVWSLPNFDAYSGHIVAGRIVDTVSPCSGDVVASSRLKRALIYCGEFRGEWVLCEIGDDEGRYVFSKPHPVDVIDVEVVKEFADKVFSSIQKQPLPGASVHFGSGKRAIYLGKTNRLSGNHFVAVEGDSSIDGINFSFKEKRWRIQTLLPELMTAHELPEDDGVELLLHIRGLLSH